MASLTLFHVLIYDTRHCADAVLSFANEVTLVARVTAPLLDFVSIWAQSSSDYDFIVAQAFPPSWCSLHRPVLSQQNPVRHSVYAAIDPLEPDGCPVICHRGCGREHLEPTVLSQKVKIKCILCQSTCEVKVTDGKVRTTLGRKDIYKAMFPRNRALTNWNPPKEQKDKGVAGQSEIGESRGRMGRNAPSQERRGRGNAPPQRPQTRSVPRLPSQTLSLPLPPLRTMSQAPLESTHLHATAHRIPASTPPIPYVQQLQVAPEFYPVHQGWQPVANPLPLPVPMLQPPTGILPLPLSTLTPLPPPPTSTSHSRRHAKRQKVEHNQPVPPS